MTRWTDPRSQEWWAAWNSWSRRMAEKPWQKPKRTSKPKPAAVGEA